MPRVNRGNTQAKFIERADSQGDTRQSAAHDFFANISAEELARAQRVKPIQRVEEIPAFSAPDPDEASWFAQGVQRWRREGRSVRKGSH